MGAIVDYLDLTQRGRLPLLRPPVLESARDAMQIDAATRRNLELTQALSGGRDGSLLSAIDRTVTAGGARLLERRISAPSRDLADIGARLESVRFLLEQSRISGDLRDDLRQCPDMDRALSRLALDRGGPRDLAAIGTGLSQAATLAARIAPDAPARLVQAAGDLLGHDDLCALLGAALADDLPLLTRDGGFIARRSRRRFGRGAAIARRGARRDRADAGRLRGAGGRAKPEDQAQQRAGLFHRNHRHACGKDAVAAAVGHVHPPPDHRQSGPLYHGAAVRDRDEDPERRQSRAGD